MSTLNGCSEDDNLLLNDPAALGDAAESIATEAKAAQTETGHSVAPANTEVGVNPPSAISATVPVGADPFAAASAFLVLSLVASRLIQIFKRNRNNGGGCES